MNLYPNITDGNIVIIMTPYGLHYGVVVMKTVLQLDVFLHSKTKNRINLQILIVLSYILAYKKNYFYIAICMTISLNCLIRGGGGCELKLSSTQPTHSGSFAFKLWIYYYAKIYSVIAILKIV